MKFKNQMREAYVLSLLRRAYKEYHQGGIAADTAMSLREARVNVERLEVQYSRGMFPSQI